MYFIYYKIDKWYKLLIITSTHTLFRKIEIFILLTEQVFLYFLNKNTEFCEIVNI